MNSDAITNSGFVCDFNCSEKVWDLTLTAAHHFVLAANYIIMFKKNNFVRQIRLKMSTDWRV